MQFKIGRLVVTAGVHQQAIDDREFNDFVQKSFNRYTKCDWGDTCIEDAALNQEAIINGDRIFAVYKYNKETDIWIITESDRSYTTILFPSEY